jgi:hypothetical protein
MAAGPSVGVIDTVLAILVAIVGLAAAGTAAYLIWGIPT